MKLIEKIYITNYATTKEGIIITTNIPAKLISNRMPSKETFVSWDKIGKLLFENYADIETLLKD